MRTPLSNKESALIFAFFIMLIIGALFYVKNLINLEIITPANAPVMPEIIQSVGAELDALNTGDLEKELQVIEKDVNAL